MKTQTGKTNPSGAQAVDVLAALDAVEEWARQVSDEAIDGEDGLRQQYAQDLRNSRAARAAVAELIAACKARDSAGRRPGSMELIEDCTGHAHAEAARYDAVQARYFAALAACGVK